MKQDLDMNDADMTQVNLACHKKSFKQNVVCNYCDRRGHIEVECYKRIVDEYNAKQTRRQQSQKQNNNRNRNHNRNHQQQRFQLSNQ